MARKTMPEPYRLADKALKILNKKIVTRFRRTGQSLQISGFDELNVYTGLKALFKQLSSDSEDLFRELAAERYKEMILFLSGEKPQKKDVDFLVEVYLAGLLKDPSDVTKYAWEAESMRKRDRTIESVIASQSRVEKENELQKSMRYWSRQNDFYIDIIADDMALQAMKDCGVKLVRWNAEKDHKVCVECESRRNKTYRIDEVPAKHPNCRCWLTPVKIGNSK